MGLTRVKGMDSQNNEKYSAWLLTPAPLVETKPIVAKPLRFQSRQKLGLAGLSQSHSGEFP